MTSSSATLERVAVKVNEEPAFSAIEVALVASVTVGDDSFSKIVNVTDCDPPSLAPPPETLSIATTAASSPSYTLSSVGVNDTVPVVLPAETVMSSRLPDPSV